ncbi:TetR family transcriptional regulator [Roseiarcaceae bacterium H3SJ34-1]|uniref:TetR/AcrR family transcriptional regulator n=1 Tax=Terripilifer ovatus TaxID=3032367 RepID=UPI003AB9A8CB|nr:TetR family transcriptional regulator [Roseiarcaceae bacterium H3SJ34-1]
MDAAVTVFAAVGVEAAAISEITSTAGLSNGIFYYHFKDKAELVDAVGRAVAAALVSEVDTAIASLQDGPERVACATEEFIARAAAEPEWGWLVVRAVGDMGSFDAQISRGIRKDVGIGLAQGRFAVEADDFLFTSLLAVVGVAVRERLRHPRAPAVERRAAELVLGMLGMPPADASSIAWRVEQTRLHKSAAGESKTRTARRAAQAKKS